MGNIFYSFRKIETAIFKFILLLMVYDVAFDKFAICNALNLMLQKYLLIAFKPSNEVFPKFSSTNTPEKHRLHKTHYKTVLLFFTYVD